MKEVVIELCSLEYTIFKFQDVRISVQIAYSISSSWKGRISPLSSFSHQAPLVMVNDDGDMDDYNPGADSYGGADSGDNDSEAAGPASMGSMGSEDAPEIRVE